MASQGRRHRTAAASGGFEAQFGGGLTGGDVWRWIRSLFDHIDETQWHSIMRPSDNKAGNVADEGHLAVVGDWGADLYGAPISAAYIKRTGGYELLLHLGDIYYSGTKTETKQRFLDAWPTSAAKVSRALNGNHGMYSGGFAYFDDILPSSNSRRVTSPCKIPTGCWSGSTLPHQSCPRHPAGSLAEIGRRKGGAAEVDPVLTSPTFLAARQAGTQPAEQLADLFQKKAITAWYWGHEHNCIIYDKHPTFGLLGRCIGHGGIPSPRRGRW